MQQSPTRSHSINYTSEFEEITPPTLYTNSPSHSSKHHLYTNVFSPKMDTSSPTSSNINLSEICNTPNTMNNILTSTYYIYNNNNHSAPLH
eukprot:495727_1